MFTMEQIRNITFACLNQSTLNKRVATAEKKVVKVHKTTIALDEMDKQLKHDYQEKDDELAERIKSFKDEHAQT